MKLVIDASVALKWILHPQQPEPDLVEALAILKALGDGLHTAHQPVHWVAEVLAVVARKAPQRIDAGLSLIQQTPFTIIDGVAVMRRAATMADALGHHLFDTLYHAVALETGAMLVTADEAYLRKAQALGQIVHLSALSPP